MGRFRGSAGSTGSAAPCSRTRGLAGPQVLERLRDRLALVALGAVELDLEIDLFAEHGHRSGGRDAYSDLFAHDRQDGHLDVVTDHDALVALSGEDQQFACLPAIVPCSSN